MSLYYETSSVIANDGNKGGTLKARVFGAKGLKNPAVKIYALAAESIKWSEQLKEVIERSGVLQLEKKLNPTLAVLLVHDLLLSKGGIAAPKNHPLRLLIEKHRVRLSSELTRHRIRQGFSSIEALREHVRKDTRQHVVEENNFPHPRWVRLNTLKSAKEAQSIPLLKAYTQTSTLGDVLRAGPLEKVYYVDEHIPDLIAVPHGHNLFTSAAYKTGEIIFQDKASCFPAYLIDPANGHGDIIDSCAAPGNKTTHLAALLVNSSSTWKDANRRIFAFEKNQHRSSILGQMVNKAGAEDIITINNSTDFLTVRPTDERFERVGALLLDPSCSGTGIIGRDDEAKMHLPVATARSTTTLASKKRKRTLPLDESVQFLDENFENEEARNDMPLVERLRALSAFQLQLIEHAMQFPQASKISYSTCSIHAEENEHVVMKALNSEIARSRGWQILPRQMQPEGLSRWRLRGSSEACLSVQIDVPIDVPIDTIVDACIRCEKGTEDGTMGFFVAGFIRDPGMNMTQNAIRLDALEQTLSPQRATSEEEEEWTGFSDNE